EAGLGAIVATDCEQRYERALRPGDRVTLSTRIESVSEEKQTGLGRGRFIDTLLTFRDALGETVGTQRFRLLKFAAPERPAGAPAMEAPRRPRPVAGEDNRFFFEALARA